MSRSIPLDTFLCLSLFPGALRLAGAAAAKQRSPAAAAGRGIRGSGGVVVVTVSRYPEARRRRTAEPGAVPKTTFPLLAMLARAKATRSHRVIQPRGGGGSGIKAGGGGTGVGGTDSGGGDHHSVLIATCRQPAARPVRARPACGGSCAGARASPPPAP